MNVGFYSMANAGGRLAGTIHSGVLYQLSGLIGRLWISAAFVLAARLRSLRLCVHARTGSRPLQFSSSVDYALPTSDVHFPADLLIPRLRAQQDARAIGLSHRSRILLQ